MMARKSKSQTIVENGRALVEVEPGEITDGAVKFKSLTDSRSLITLHAKHNVWADKDLDAAIANIGKSISESIIRLEPPNNATDADIELLAGKLKSKGAVAIRVSPRQHGDAVLVKEERSEMKIVSIRQVVMAMADESRVDDKTSLCEVLDLAMLAEGL
jgi:hypothetical protein